MKRIALIVIIAALSACIMDEPQVEEEECFSPRLAISTRVIEHVAGDCSDFGYPRSMAPGASNAEMIDSEQCGVVVHRWLVSEQLGELRTLRIRVHEADQIWEQWITTVEIDGEVCVEFYVVTFEPSD